MNVRIERYSRNNESTLGLLYIDGKFECYTLEDEKREIKVPGETRIPSGAYDLRFRQVMTPMTQRYRIKYPFFTWHIQVMNVPGFNYIYLHAGNTDDDTDGCILLGDTANNNKYADGFIGNSSQAFKRVYAKIANNLTISTATIIILDKD